MQFPFEEIMDARSEKADNATYENKDDKYLDHHGSWK